MKAKSQGSQYDKIFKENIEAVIRSIVKNVPHGRPVGITAISLEELPDYYHTRRFFKSIKTISNQCHPCAKIDDNSTRMTLIQLIHTDKIKIFGFST